MDKVIPIPGNEELTQHPLVSVIIPVYNGERYLEQTIQSVITQTENRWEIIIVNDGSTDASQKILDAQQAVLKERCHIITSQNKGVSCARNTAVRFSTGKYIAFLDQDDLWHSEKLDKQIQVLSDNTSIDLIYSNESVINDKGDLIKNSVLNLNRQHRGRVFHNLLFDNFIPISSVMMRKDLFEQIGGFNEDYYLAEDFDFLLKVAEKGRFDFIDEPLLHYREHQQSGTAYKIDRIMTESFRILDYWCERCPGLYRRFFFKYYRFKIKFYYLKLKIVVKIR
jgi:glycosyltransferase involved in cell wall biosynthesis